MLLIDIGLVTSVRASGDIVIWMSPGTVVVVGILE